MDTLSPISIGISIPLSNPFSGIRIVPFNKLLQALYIAVRFHNSEKGDHTVAESATQLT